jgi:hypothetical protein
MMAYITNPYPPNTTMGARVILRKLKMAKEDNSYSDEKKDVVLTLKRKLLIVHGTKKRN